MSNSFSVLVNSTPVESRALSNNFLLPGSGLQFVAVKFKISRDVFSSKVPEYESSNFPLSSISKKV